MITALIVLSGVLFVIVGIIDLCLLAKGYGVKGRHVVYVKPKKATDNEKLWLGMWGALFISGGIGLIYKGLEYIGRYVK